jgi:hypothetical protein
MITCTRYSLFIVEPIPKYNMARVYFEISGKNYIQHDPPLRIAEVVKTGIFDEPDLLEPIMSRKWAWRIEFSYKYIREQWGQSKGQVRSTPDSSRPSLTSHLNCLKQKKL